MYIKIIFIYIFDVGLIVTTKYEKLVNGAASCAVVSSHNP